MNDSVIINFEITGECDVDVSEVAKQWDENSSISQWHEEYTLCQHDKSAENFTKTTFKVKIPKIQALEIIGKLNLVDIKSPIFNNARTWRKAIAASKHRQYSAYLSNGGTMTMEEWERDGRWDKSL